ncbi:GGDEF domain-containing protein [Thalassotalea sp. 1_MG-2023]|uniref:GGDEF domain-containing protein n=1 Tax=Thalassotalea sp. 1_MG-2023 TaxID=3062680 RepID=UPI0026E15142|nr:GGDEF domain-containing protein [Thalassotalea sp. 1_MG-2023]MDO6427284.1 GGDEF domain-containing protein [Thalassotalea sp. 1_MG-2023]
MQTLNLVNNDHIEFNAFTLFDTQDRQNNSRKLALAEQLQTSLEIDTILNIFAMEATKFVDFTGLYFKSDVTSGEMRGSKLARKERHFELKINKRYIGTLTYALNKPMPLASYNMLKNLHTLLVHPLNNAMLYQQALSLAMQDGLTGLGNRRHFDQQIKRAMHHANRQGTKVGLIVCDLNKFKAVNDNHGHHVGDQVLTHFAQALIESVRDSESLFRFGGDEFAIIVENADEQALTIIESRLQHSVNTDSLLARYKVGSSIGCALMTRADNEYSLFERADSCLYQQKLAQPCRLSII